MSCVQRVYHAHEGVVLMCWCAVCGVWAARQGAVSCSVVCGVVLCSHTFLRGRRMVHSASSRPRVQRGDATRCAKRQKNQKIKSFLWT